MPIHVKKVYNEETGENSIRQASSANSAADDFDECAMAAVTEEDIDDDGDNKAAEAAPLLPKSDDTPRGPSFRAGSIRPEPAFGGDPKQPLKDLLDDIPQPGGSGPSNATLPYDQVDNLGPARDELTTWIATPPGPVKFPEERKPEDLKTSYNIGKT